MRPSEKQVMLVMGTVILVVVIVIAAILGAIPR